MNSINFIYVILIIGAFASTAVFASVGDSCVVDTLVFLTGDMTCQNPTVCANGGKVPVSGDHGCLNGLSCCVNGGSCTTSSGKTGRCVAESYCAHGDFSQASSCPGDSVCCANCMDDGTKAAVGSTCCAQSGADMLYFGTCGLESSCDANGDSFVTDRCLGDSSIRCCVDVKSQNYKCTDTSTGEAGTCTHADECWDGKFASSSTSCPATSKCCIKPKINSCPHPDNPVKPAVGEACCQHYNDFNDAFHGVCGSQAACEGGGNTFQPDLCGGDSSVRCCIPVEKKSFSCSAYVNGATLSGECKTASSCGAGKSLMAPDFYSTCPGSSSCCVSASAATDPPTRKPPTPTPPVTNPPTPAVPIGTCPDPFGAKPAFGQTCCQLEDGQTFTGTCSSESSCVNAGNTYEPGLCSGDNTVRCCLDVTTKNYACTGTFNGNRYSGTCRTSVSCGSDGVLALESSTCPGLSKCCTPSSEVPLDEFPLYTVTEDTLYEFINAARGGGSSFSRQRAAETTPYLRDALRKYGIDRGYLRFIYFLSAIVHESAYFRTWTEYGEANCPRYSGGCRYKGRGAIQLTHDYNYESASLALNDPSILSNPEQVASDKLAFEVSGMYWKGRGLSYFADEDNTYQVARRINGCFDCDRYLSSFLSIASKAKSIFPRKPVPDRIESPRECFLFRSSYGSASGQHGECVEQNLCSGTVFGGACPKDGASVKCCVSGRQEGWKDSFDESDYDDAGFRVTPIDAGGLGDAEVAFIIVAVVVGLLIVAAVIAFFVYLKRRKPRDGGVFSTSLRGGARSTRTRSRGQSGLRPHMRTKNSSERVLRSSMRTSSHQSIRQSRTRSRGGSQLNGGLPAMDLHTMVTGVTK